MEKHASENSWPSPQDSIILALPYLDLTIQEWSWYFHGVYLSAIEEQRQPLCKMNVLLISVLWGCGRSGDHPGAFLILRLGEGTEQPWRVRLWLTSSLDFSEYSCFHTNLLICCPANPTQTCMSLPTFATAELEKCRVGCPPDRRCNNHMTLTPLDLETGLASLNLGNQLVRIYLF